MNPETSCKECVFAKYENSDTCITQTGCEMDMIDKFIAKDIQVDECYDNEREFYVIRRRICPYFSKSLGGLSLEERKAFAKENVRLTFHAIVFIKSNDIADLEKTLLTLYGQEILPQRLTVVRPFGCLLRIKEIMKLFNNDAIPSNIEDLQEPMDDDLIVHRIVRSHKLPYYATFNSGYVIQFRFFADINNLVINKLNTFAAILPEEQGNGLVVPFSVHQYWHYNNPELSVLDNIKEYECQNNDKITYNHQDLLS